MNKPERRIITGGVRKDALVMSATEYADWEQSRAGINNPTLNRAQRRALERSNRRAK